MFRTPAKSDSPDEKRNRTVTIADHERGETSKVRSSIDRWESGSDLSRASLSPPLQPKVVTKAAKQARTHPAAKKPPTAMSASPPRLTEGKKNDRIAEARALLHKTKLNINSSRNTRTEIKNAIIECAERLFQLVKEASAAKTQLTGTPQTETSEREASTNDPEDRAKNQDKELKELLKENTALLKETTHKMDLLKEELSQKTYANVAAAAPVRKTLPEHKVLHSVVITATDETESSEEVLNKIRTVMNAKEGGITVDKIRRAKDRKVIVGCRTEEERRRVKERLTSATDLKVEEMKNKNPLVALKNVLLFNTDADILTALRNQNRNVFAGLGEQESKIEVAYRRRTRNPHTGHVVLRVSTVVWKRMTGAEAVHIDLQRVRVEDQSPLVQCSLCLGYGHGRRFCTESVERCSHCGGAHMKAQCADWLAGVPPTCCNCRHAKLDKTEHNAFDSECPIRKKWDTLARTAVAYC